MGLTSCNSVLLAVAPPCNCFNEVNSNVPMFCDDNISGREVAMTVERPLTGTVEVGFLFFGDGRDPDARDTS